MREGSRIQGAVIGAVETAPVELVAAALGGSHERGDAREFGGVVALQDLHFRDRFYSCASLLQYLV